MYLENVLRRLREENPVFLDIVYLRADGLTLDEISEKLNIPRTTLHRMLKKIRRIAERID
jgi:predicted transcriptional regulator